MYKKAFQWSSVEAGGLCVRACESVSQRERERERERIYLQKPFSTCKAVLTIPFSSPVWFFLFQRFLSFPWNLFFARKCYFNELKAASVAACVCVCVKERERVREMRMQSSKPLSQFRASCLSFEDSYSLEQDILNVLRSTLDRWLIASGEK